MDAHQCYLSYFKGIILVKHLADKMAPNLTYLTLQKEILIKSELKGTQSLIILLTRFSLFLFVAFFLFCLVYPWPICTDSTLLHLIPRNALHGTSLSSDSITYTVTCITCSVTCITCSVTCITCSVTYIHAELMTQWHIFHSAICSVCLRN